MKNRILRYPPPSKEVPKKAEIVDLQTPAIHKEPSLPSLKESFKPSAFAAQSINVAMLIKIFGIACLIVLEESKGGIDVIPPRARALVNLAFYSEGKRFYIVEEKTK